jgi:hypothetical protein
MRSSEHIGELSCFTFKGPVGPVSPIRDATPLAETLPSAGIASELPASEVLIESIQ